MDISCRLMVHVTCVIQRYENYLQDLRDQKQQNEKDNKDTVESENNLKRRSEEKKENMTKMEVTSETLKEETKICLDSMSNHRLFMQTSNLEYLF